MNIYAWLKEKTPFRLRRMQKFYEYFGITPNTRVLDVGGDYFNWSVMPFIPDLFILNLNFSKELPNGNYIIGDGRFLPFKDGSFDVLFSNATIEHVGEYEDQVKFANEIMRVGRAHFVTTPNKNFFFETHFLTPFIHWFPRSVQLKILRNFTIWGLITRPNIKECQEQLKRLYLLDIFQVRMLFPQSKVIIERFLGLAKTIIVMIKDKNTVVWNPQFNQK